MSEEIEIIGNVLKKIEEKYPNILLYAYSEFSDDFAEAKGMIEEYFLGWIFCDYVLFSGKRLQDLIRESIETTNKEQEILKNISNIVTGYFEVLSQTSHELKLKDLLTENEYIVEIMDLGYKFKEEEIIEARLVKNFRNKLFLFGGTAIMTSHRDELLAKMKTYLYEDIESE